MDCKHSQHAARRAGERTRRYRRYQRARHRARLQALHARNIQMRTRRSWRNPLATSEGRWPRRSLLERRYTVTGAMQEYEQELAALWQELRDFNAEMAREQEYLYAETWLDWQIGRGDYDTDDE